MACLLPACGSAPPTSPSPLSWQLTATAAAQVGQAAQGAISLAASATSASVQSTQVAQDQALSGLTTQTPLAATAVSLQATSAVIASQAAAEATAAPRRTVEAYAQATLSAQATATRAALLTTLEEDRLSEQTRYRFLQHSILLGFELVLLAFFIFVVYTATCFINIRREKAEIDARLRSTPYGAVLILPSSSGQVSYQYLLPPPRSDLATVSSSASEGGETAAEAAEAEETDESASASPPPSLSSSPPPPPPVRFSANGGKTVTYYHTESTRPVALEEVIALLREAMQVAAPEANTIPRYDRLPSFAANAGRWVVLTDRLRDSGLVTKTSGRYGGTRLTGGRSLYTLTAALESGSLGLTASVL